ncbi:uncharacterized protein LOC110446987 [Mizuhopecten yessoensis]|uniref:uncharacterized protein LOC110446987 n=1 Tax=Mizuhopecten yessoensis TaxID=6573 RepID=UPI000B45F592|nr:uncharacterized protein LOC110446987 [Mizuhopecten yessoensis]
MPSHSNAMPDCPGTVFQTLNDLLEASLSKPSHKSYNHALQLFNRFCLQYLHLHVRLPINYTIVVLYVAYAHSMKFAHSTIASHLSAISFVHNLHGYVDPTKTFLVRKALQGSARLARSYDTRLPITEHILIKLCKALPSTVSDPEVQVLVQADFTVAFYSLARTGELLSNNAHVNHLLQLSDVAFEHNDRIAVMMHITFREIKHNTACKPHVIPVVAISESLFCPVQSVIKFGQIRSSGSAPLFVLPRGLPFPRKRFDAITSRCLRFYDLDTSRYKGHSFRIGGASCAADKDLSDAQIRQLGRWKTDAFKRYIRTTAI